MHALRNGEMDAYFEVSDALVIIQTQLIIDTARIKKLPTMFNYVSSVIKGGPRQLQRDRHEVAAISEVRQRILAGVTQGLAVQGSIRSRLSST